MITNPPKILVAFLNKLVDYAGLFPPAQLSLKESFNNFIKYRIGDYGWILSKFICPVKLLSELKILINTNYKNEDNISLSILCRGGHDEEDFKNILEEDLKMWNEFLSDEKDKFVTNCFEVTLPDEIITTHDNKKISTLIDLVSEGVNENINQPVFIFFEGNIGKEWKKNIRSLIEGIKIHNEKKNNSGFKLRTGGAEAYTYPTSEQVAFTIRECLDREIQMKCTAGLHHPFRHYDESIGTMMHGFINVFGAGIIAMRHNISNFGLKEILNDENPKNFIFTDEYFSWKDWKIEIGEIELARKDLMISFGSCSFDEPIDDLKSLNLL